MVPAATRKSNLSDERGVSMVETSLVLALIAIAAIAVLGSTSKRVRLPINMAACKLAGGNFMPFDCGVPSCNPNVTGGGYIFDNSDGVCVQDDPMMAIVIPACTC